MCIFRCLKQTGRDAAHTVPLLTLSGGLFFRLMLRGWITRVPWPVISFTLYSYIYTKKKNVYESARIFFNFWDTCWRFQDVSFSGEARRLICILDVNTHVGWGDFALLRAISAAGKLRIYNFAPRDLFNIHSASRTRSAPMKRRRVISCSHLAPCKLLCGAIKNPLVHLCWN